MPDTVAMAAIKSVAKKRLGLLWELVNVDGADSQIQPRKLPRPSGLPDDMCVDITLCDIEVTPARATGQVYIAGDYCCSIVSVEWVPPILRGRSHKLMACALNVPQARDWASTILKSLYDVGLTYEPKDYPGRISGEITHQLIADGRDLTLRLTGIEVIGSRIHGRLHVSAVGYPEQITDVEWESPAAESEEPDAPDDEMGPCERVFDQVEGLFDREARHEMGRAVDAEIGKVRKLMQAHLYRKHRGSVR